MGTGHTRRPFHRGAAVRANHQHILLRSYPVLPKKVTDAVNEMNVSRKNGMIKSRGMFQKMELVVPSVGFRQPLNQPLH